MSLLESRMLLVNLAAGKQLNRVTEAVMNNLVAEKQLKVGHERFCSLIEGNNCFFAIIVSYLGDGLKFNCLFAINYWSLAETNLKRKGPDR